MSKAINIIFPHQLFKNSALLENKHEIYLIEEYLFFRQYNFHKQKIAFHRSTMKSYESFLIKKGHKVNYFQASENKADIRNLYAILEGNKIDEVHCIDPNDDWLENRLVESVKEKSLIIHEGPQFLNAKDDLQPFFRTDKKSFFQTTFYKQQRKKRNILLNDDGQPEGGQWTFDKENRKKYPKGKTPPPIHFPKPSEFWNEACEYTNQHFKNNIGELDENRLYPISFQESQEWLDQFLNYRFHDFGPYEDAIVKEHSILNHSILSPLLNTGLLTPKEVINKILQFAQKEKIPINSTEGFVRQIIGWREFIRGMYVCKGRFSRSRNFWNFNRSIPKSFYNGTTGVTPIDETIKKVLKTGYCHHIERLMILGNFMLLCEFDPDEVYRWFMELFIDAYDWVMVPNVYGMCLFADGGTFATKPYIGGSNYIKKMSNYTAGEWEQIWDGLFWRFIGQHKSFFSNNPRTSMMVYNYDKMSDDKREQHQVKAELFLEKLYVS